MTQTRKDDIARRAEACRLELQSLYTNAGPTLIEAIIEDHIRLAVMAERKTCDDILTDMQIESEAFRAGWELGTQAHEDGIVRVLTTARNLLGIEKTDLVTIIAHIRGVPLPLPPSHDHRGVEPLPPSRLRRRAELMEKALREIVAGNYDNARCLAVERIAREALEDNHE